MVLGTLLVSCGQDASLPAQTAARDDWPSLDAEAAYRHAVALQQAGLHLESLPYFRRAMRAQEGIGQLHLEYGEALHNAAIETDLRFGSVRFVVPSSQERTALANEAVLEVRRAVELARTTDERAYALFILGRMQSLMGLQADALESVMAARTLAPDVGVMKDFESSLRAILKDDQCR
jgi:tetratricopeptide (TPR) repeat protein